MSQSPSQDPNDRAGNFIVFFPMGALAGAVLFDYTGSLANSVVYALFLAIFIIGMDYLKVALKKWVAKE